MNAIRSRLTYANVVSTICLFLILGGATAFAANRIGRGSIGAAQLKPEAITAAKLRDGAVTGEKLAAGSVDAAKLAIGSVDAAKLAPALASVGITHTVTSSGSLSFPPNGSPATFLPLENPTFTQPAGEDELLIGRVNVLFPPQCKTPREAEVFLEVNGQGFGDRQVIGQAEVTDQSGDEFASITTQFGPTDHGYDVLARKPEAQPRTLFVKFGHFLCATGTAPNVFASLSNVQIDVVGIK